MYQYKVKGDILQEKNSIYVGDFINYCNILYASASTSILTEFIDLFYSRKNVIIEVNLLNSF